MTNDTLSDLVVRLKNAQGAGRTEFVVPHTNQSMALLQLLQREGYVAGLTKEEATPQDTIRVRFADNRPQPFRLLRRVSTPGQRVYRGYRDLMRPLSGYGIAVVSTPKGFLTDREARREKLGGEVICLVA